MTLTFHRYGSKATTDTLELDETKSSIIDKLNEPTRLSAILTSTTAPQIALGNYTTYEGTRYYVTKEPTVRKEHSQLYTVEVDLERSLGLARITILANPVDHRTTFDYTATATEHLQLIVDCLNAKFGEVGLKWSRGAVHCKDTVKHIKYDGSTVLGALQQIRETYETDIFADGETLSLGQVDDKTTALPLAYGKGKGLLSGLERHKHTDDTVPTRLYVTGTKRNMGMGRLTLQRGVVLAVDRKSGAIERHSGDLSAVADERTFYSTDKAGQYIAEWSPMDKFKMWETRFPTEATYTNEEIYPSHVSTIKSVAKVKDHYEVNSDFNYTALLIEGEQMQVVFQTGNLAGRDFDAKYFASSGRLAIVPKEEDDTTLPSDILCPKVGDQYIVTGIKLPDQYIREAERNLTDEALRHLIKLQETRYSYKADIDPVYLHDHHSTIAHQLAVGRYVHLTDPQITIGDPYVRIVGKRTYLDRPYTPEIELSNEVEPRSELTRVLNELDRQDNGLIYILDRLRQSGLTLGELTEGVGELTVSAEDMRKRLKEAEEELKQKLGSEDFSKWQEGDFKQALATKQPAGSYALTSELVSSAQHTLAEALKRAGEMDKAIKVGGRNLITRASLRKATTDDGYGFVLELDEANDCWLSVSRDYPQAKAGDTVTLSMLIRCDKSEWGASEWVIRVSDSQGSLEYLDPNKEVFGEFYRHTWTFDLREGGKLPNVQLYNHVWRKDENGRTKFNKRIEAKYIKLERGTVATDWTPAPEDVAESVSKVNTSVTSLTSLLESHKTATDKSFAELSNHPLTIDKDGYWRIWNLKQQQYVTTQYPSRGRDGQNGAKGDKGEPGDKGEKGDTPNLSLDSQYRLVADGKLVSAVSLKGRDGQDGAKGADGHTPELSLDSQYRLLADGQLLSQQSLKGRDGEDGHTPNIRWSGTHLLIDDLQAVDLRGQRGEAGHTPELHVGEDDYLYIDGVQQRYIRGRQGEPGHSPNPTEVLNTDSFRQRLTSEVTEQIQPVATDLDRIAREAIGKADASLAGLENTNQHIEFVSQELSSASGRIDDLDKRSFTTDQKRDLDYLTNSLQVLRSAGNNTLEGLALQRLIALSGDNQTVSAYLASNAMPAVLKAGITNFGTPQEREQVEITHQGSGHFGNLYFAGDTIDFRTSQYTDPYLSIGAEEATFIETFLKQARLDDTPVTVSSISLTPTSTGYQRTITTDNDGTRLTITLDRINIATFDNTFTRLTLDDETLAEWRGTITNREKYRNGILVLEPVRTPYEATGLTYERVVKAGTHTLRLQIINPQSPYTATINGLKVRRRYDTGAQQSLLTKSGLRLFGSPDRYLDVDYRQRYTPNGGQYTVVNPYLVRIKGGAKIDKLTTDELDMPGVPLCGATFNESGGCINSFGERAKQQGGSVVQAYRAYNADFYRVYHSIGHKRYIPVLQVYGLSNNNHTQCLTTRIDAIEANSFAVRIVTTGNVSIKHSFSYVAFKTTE